MPKGVEHFSDSSTSTSADTVSFPVMPKGVEHFDLPFDGGFDAPVSFPVMPKGVEHFCSCSAFKLIEV